MHSPGRSGLSMTSSSLQYWLSGGQWVSAIFLVVAPSHHSLLATTVTGSSHNLWSTIFVPYGALVVAISSSRMSMTLVASAELCPTPCRGQVESVASVELCNQLSAFDFSGSGSISLLKTCTTDELDLSSLTNPHVSNGSQKGERLLHYAMC